MRSGVAQRKRVGLITQRTVDRNHPPLVFAVGLGLWAQGLGLRLRLKVQKMRLEGFEPPIFGSGIRRLAVRP